MYVGALLSCLPAVNENDWLFACMHSRDSIHSTCSSKKWRACSHEDTDSGPETDREDQPGPSKVTKTKVLLGTLRSSIKPGSLLFRCARSKLMPIGFTTLCAYAVLAAAIWVDTTWNNTSGWPLTKQT